MVCHVLMTVAQPDIEMDLTGAKSGSLDVAGYVVNDYSESS